MKNKPVEVVCIYSGEGDLRQIFFEVFRHFLKNKLANRHRLML